MKVVGVQTEVKKVGVEITEEELLRALRTRVGLSGLTLNEEETELGYWSDVSLERSNFEDLRWICKSKDKGLIELFKVIKVLEGYILEESK